MTSPPAVPLIVGYVATQTERARITSALRGWARTQWADSLAELASVARRARGGPTTVIVAARDEHGHAAAPVVQDLVRHTPHVPVIAYCRTGIEHAADIRQMAEAGAHEFLFVGVDDTGLALRAVLASAQRTCAAEGVLLAVRPVLPEPLHRVAEYCVTHPAQARTVSGVAELLGIHRKTLLNQCVRAGGPAPAELIAWCRLMLAAQLLATTGQTVEWVALELDYPSDTALRNAMKRYTGLRAGDVRRQGGLRCVLDAYARRS